MNRAIVALNRMIIYCNTALTQIRISFQGTFLPKIIQRCDNFKCRSRRICSICGTVKKATVILVINEAIPVLCYGITSCSQFAAIVFGSKSGLLTIARILPVDGSNTTTAPLRSPREL